MADTADLRHRIEALAFNGGMSLFRLLGRDRSSAFGGALARAVGPHVSRHKMALANMARALPELSEAEREAAMMQVWDNLGRNFGEYPHLGAFTSKGPNPDIEVEGRENLEPFAEPGKAAIFVSGHFANWELMPLVVAEAGVEGAEVYRAPNNRAVDEWITAMRQRHIMKVQVPKGPAGARELVKCVRGGISLCLLADQKMNDGIESTLFGRPAMSPAAPATLALRYGVPLVPVSFVRTQGTHFRIRFWPALDISRTENLQDDVARVTRTVNAFLEERIRENPGMWLWLHRRWRD